MAGRADSKAVFEYFFFSLIRFIAEESESLNRPLCDDPTWIIDPIDGTNNYVQRIPLCAISVAFTWRKETVVGIIYNPILNSFYSARSGKGAFLNDAPIRCSRTETVEDATLAQEISFIHVERHRERNSKQVLAFAKAAKGYVQPGTEGKRSPAF